MGLSTLELPRTFIPVGPDDGFEVRALSYTDVMVLCHRHKAALIDMVVLFDEAAQAKGGDDHSMEDAIDSFLLTFVDQMPDLVAEIIALAADEPNAVESVKKIGLSAQLDALLTIGHMTFEDQHGVKKLMEQLSNLIASGRQVFQEVQKVQKSALTAG